MKDGYPERGLAGKFASKGKVTRRSTDQTNVRQIRINPRTHEAYKSSAPQALPLLLAPLLRP